MRKYLSWSNLIVAKLRPTSPPGFHLRKGARHLKEWSVAKTTLIILRKQREISAWEQIAAKTWCSGNILGVDSEKKRLVG